MIPYYLSQILSIGFSQLNFSSILSIESGSYEVTEKLISILIGIFSILLLLLSISSYRKTGLRSILYAAGAFGLFAVSLFLEALDENYNILDNYLVDLFSSSITLTILILFFLAIVKKNK